MEYKRPNLKPPSQKPNLEKYWGVYGTINTDADAPWICPHLTELHEDGAFLLHFFESQLKALQSLDVSDFKPEVAAAKKTEIITNARKKVLAGLKKHIEKYKDECKKVEQAILRVSQPESHSDPMKQLQQEMKFREIRDLIRATEPRKREEVVAGNLAYLQAIQEAPDEIIPKDTLNRLRRDFAFKADPTLRDMEADQTLIYKAVRRRAADINATSVKIMQLNRIEDPTHPIDYFETFTPQTDHEFEYAEKRIKDFESRAAAIERKKEYEAKEKGVNLGVDAKAERVDRQYRIERGIPH